MLVLILVFIGVPGLYAQSWWEKSPNNWKNSPNNWDNSPNNRNRQNRIYDNSGRSSEYYAPKPGGGLNIYDNRGNQRGYSGGYSNEMTDPLPITPK